MTVYLSRLTLNPRHRDVQRDIADCQQLHCTVANAFGPADAGGVRERTGALYRLDIEGRSVTLLVQSREQPDWRHLAPDYLAPWTEEENPACKRVDGLYAALSPGQIVKFRLRANPTKRLLRADKSGRAGQRVDLLQEADQLKWLDGKGKSGGFVLLSVRAQPGFGAPVGVEAPDVQALTGGKSHGRRGGKRLTFGAVTFEGRLQVTDVQRFLETLCTGIGSGKAYGFGLLSIAPGD